MTTNDQDLSFETIRNFRDFGGYRTQGGRRLRKGLLYRSGHFPKASSADLQLLEALKIQTLVDLRSPLERESHPTPRWPGFSAHVVADEEPSGGALAPHLSAFLNAGGSAEAARAAMLEVYRGLPFEPAIMALYRRYFAALAEGDGAVLVHCAAGKDRTGLAVALTHHLTGVDRSDLEEDYLATNRSGLASDARIAQARSNLAQGGRIVSDDAIRTVLSVAPEYLDAAFGAIAARAGSLDAYLQDVLDVAPERRAAIVRRLTVED